MKIVEDYDFEGLRQFVTEENIEYYEQIKNGNPTEFMTFLEEYYETRHITCKELNRFLSACKKHMKNHFLIDEL